MDPGEPTWEVAALTPVCTGALSVPHGCLLGRLTPWLGAGETCLTVPGPRVLGPPGVAGAEPQNQPETLADAHRPCSKRQALSMATGSHNRLWAAVNTRLQQAQESELNSPYCQEIATDQGLRERHRHMHTEIEIQRQRGRQRHRERHRRQRRETGNTDTEID